MVTPHLGITPPFTINRRVLLVNKHRNEIHVGIDHSLTTRTTKQLRRCICRVDWSCQLRDVPLSEPNAPNWEKFLQVDFSHTFELCLNSLPSGNELILKSTLKTFYSRQKLVSFTSTEAQPREYITKLPPIVTCDSILAAQQDLPVHLVRGKEAFHALIS